MGVGVMTSGGPGRTWANLGGSARACWRARPGALTTGQVGEPGRAGAGLGWWADMTTARSARSSYKPRHHSHVWAQRGSLVGVGLARLGKAETPPWGPNHGSGGAGGRVVRRLCGGCAPGCAGYPSGFITCCAGCAPWG